MLNDAQKEAAWSKMTESERIQLWTTVPCEERLRYLPPSERKVRSKCHADLLYRRIVYFRDSHSKDWPVGFTAACSQCFRSNGPLRLSRAQVEAAGLIRFTLADWTACNDAMKASKSNLGLYTCEIGPDGRLRSCDPGQPEPKAERAAGRWIERSVIE